MALGLVIVLVILFNPMDFYYNNMGVSLLITILVLLFVFFSVFSWKGDLRDEREVAHSHFASRVAYLSGTTVMVVGIAYQAFMHDMDVWLVIALVVMILGKIFAGRYSERNF